MVAQDVYLSLVFLSQQHKIIILYLGLWISLD